MADNTTCPNRRERNAIASQNSHKPKNQAKKFPSMRSMHKSVRPEYGLKLDRTHTHMVTHSDVKSHSIWKYDVYNLFSSHGVRTPGHSRPVVYQIIYKLWEDYDDYQASVRECTNALSSKHAHEIPRMSPILVKLIGISKSLHGLIRYLL